MIPAGDELLRFDTSGQLVARYRHPEVTDIKAVTPAEPATIPPFGLELMTAGVLHGQSVDTVVGTLHETGPADDSTMHFALDHTRIQRVINQGDPWKYNDLGIQPDGDWTAAGFDDGAWQSGDAPLGYGDSFISTTLDFGSDPNAKRISYYFRRSIDAGDLPLVGGIIHLHRDDGAVVYLNGKEAARTNMPAGPVFAGTRALNASDGWVTFELSSDLLKAGKNQLAVEIHQTAITSSDVAFDMELDLIYKEDYDNLLFRTDGSNLVFAQPVGAAILGSGKPLQVKLRATDSVGRTISELMLIPIRPFAAAATMLEGGDVQVEFASEPGASYRVEYLHDGTWLTAVSNLVAAGDATAWVDRGPPETIEHPSVASTRIYRAVNLDQ